MVLATLGGDGLCWSLVDFAGRASQGVEVGVSLSLRSDKGAQIGCSRGSEVGLTGMTGHCHYRQVLSPGRKP